MPGKQARSNDRVKGRKTRSTAQAPKKGSSARRLTDERYATESSFVEAESAVVLRTIVYPPVLAEPTQRDASGSMEVALIAEDDTLGGRLRPSEGAHFDTREISRFATARSINLRETQRARLPDIARLSDAFRSPSTETSSTRIAEIVIGKDDRNRVPRTNVYPWSAIASLLITTKDGAVGVGTGWFVSDRLLITAGHCVFIHCSNERRHGWVRSITVIPGRDGAKTPFGSFTTTQFRSVKGWTRDQDEGFDYGAVLLPDGIAPGSRTGVFGLGALSDQDFTNLKVSVSGYPDDKSGSEVGTQWLDAQQVAATSAHQVSYFTDTAGGQSGSPVFCVRDDHYIAAAIHAYGDTASNSGTRITPDVLRVIRGWMGR